MGGLFFIFFFAISFSFSVCSIHTRQCCEIRIVSLLLSRIRQFRLLSSSLLYAPASICCHLFTSLFHIDSQAIVGQQQPHYHSVTSDMAYTAVTYIRVSAYRENSTEHNTHTRTYHHKEYIKKRNTLKMRECVDIVLQAVKRF